MRLTPNIKRLFSAVLACAMMLCTLVGCGAAEDEKQGNEPPKISYATDGVTSVEDEDDLRKAIEEMEKKNQQAGIALEFRNDAISSDGINFECYVANSVNNAYDMFITILADQELTDQLYLSGLIRPGTAFRTLKLDRALEPGNHLVYVVFTLVKEDLATIYDQVVVTMNFVVTG